MSETLEQWSYIATIAASVVAAGVGIIVFFQLRLAFRQMGAIQTQIAISDEALRVAKGSLEKTAESLVISARAADAAQDAAVEARRSADAAQESVVAAGRSADAAQESIVEAARARIDAVSPYLVVLVEEPNWPPFLDTTTSATIQNSAPKRLNTEEDAAVDPGHVFYLPQDLDGFLWYRVRGVVRNEGARSGLVILNGDARFIRSQTLLAPGTTFETPPINHSWRGPNRAYTGHRYLLQPGQIAVFEWAAGAPMRQAWDSLNAQSQFADTLAICAFSVTKVGFRDEIKIEFGAKPLTRVPGREGAGTISGSDSAATSVHPMQREYLGLGEVTSELLNSNVTLKSTTPASCDRL